MTDPVESRKKTASRQKRDNYGQFVVPKTHSPAHTPSTDTVPTSPEVKPITVNTKKSTLEDPLVSININNPFKKLLLWIDQIRKKQNTELSLKIKLPLAVTLSIAAMALGIATTGQYIYNWGKYIGITQAKATTVATPITRIGILMGSKTATGAHSRYILATAGGEVFILEPPPNTNLSSFIDHRVLVTGHQDATTNTLKISSMRDIEIMD